MNFCQKTIKIAQRLFGTEEYNVNFVVVRFVFCNQSKIEPKTPSLLHGLDRNELLGADHRSPTYPELFVAKLVYYNTSN